MNITTVLLDPLSISPKLRPWPLDRLLGTRLSAELATFMWPVIEPFTVGPLCLLQKKRGPTPLSLFEELMVIVLLSVATVPPVGGVADTRRKVVMRPQQFVQRPVTMLPGFVQRSPSSPLPSTSGGSTTNILETSGQFPS